MAKFNESTKGKRTVTNHMGAKAYKHKPEFELVSILLTSFMENSYYESSATTLNRLKEALGKVDAKFAAKAAVYARNEFGMRSVSHVLSVELMKYISGKEWGKKFFESIVRRPDDMSEIISYYFKDGKKSLPNSLKKGFAKAFEKFDRYQIAKYRGAKKTVSLIDVVNLVHPKATEKNEQALKDLVNGTLKNVDTWESKLTKAGQDSTTKKEKEENKSKAWAELLNTNKMPYMALLRNLRNILEQAPETLDKVCETLENKKMIKNSLVLPFRFLSAYGEVEKLKTAGMFEKEKTNINRVLESIENAMKLSIDNLPILYGKTLILSDNSGSMRGDGGGNSKVSRFSNTKTSDIANLFAVLYWLKSDNTRVGLFGDRLVEPDLYRKAGIFKNFQIIDSAAKKCGYSTEQGIFKIFEEIVKNKTHVDTVVVFSDCQVGTSCNWYDLHGNHGSDFNKLFESYRKINPDVRVYSVDLKGYGSDVFSDNAIKITGWSDKIFDIMKIMEQDKNALIKIINEYVDF